MKRRFRQTKTFENVINEPIATRRLFKKDFDDLKTKLSKEPDSGSVIPGCGGIRKIRLKSATKGKSGGFRVCYLNVEDVVVTVFVFMYGKNTQENLTAKQKIELKKLVETIKRRVRNGEPL